MDIVLSHASQGIYAGEVEFMLTVDPETNKAIGWFDKEEAESFWSKNGVEEALGIELDSSIWTRIARAKFGELQVELLTVQDLDRKTEDLVAVVTDDSNRLDYYLA